MVAGSFGGAEIRGTSSYRAGWRVSAVSGLMGRACGVGVMVWGIRAVAGGGGKGGGRGRFLPRRRPTLRGWARLVGTLARAGRASGVPCGLDLECGAAVSPSKRPTSAGRPGSFRPVRGAGLAAAQDRPGESALGVAGGGTCERPYAGGPALPGPNHIDGRSFEAFPGTWITLGRDQRPHLRCRGRRRPRLAPATAGGDAGATCGIASRRTYRRPPAGRHPACSKRRRGPAGAGGEPRAAGRSPGCDRRPGGACPASLGPFARRLLQPRAGRRTPGERAATVRVAPRTGKAGRFGCPHVGRRGDGRERASPERGRDGTRAGGPAGR